MPPEQSRRASYISWLELSARGSAPSRLERRFVPAPSRARHSPGPEAPGCASWGVRARAATKRAAGICLGNAGDVLSVALVHCSPRKAGASSCCGQVARAHERICDRLGVFWSGQASALVGPVRLGGHPAVRRCAPDPRILHHESVGAETDVADEVALRALSTPEAGMRTSSLRSIVPPPGGRVAGSLLS
jgi:hypothetical protein